MIDRVAREEMLDVINRYLTGQIGAFEFDDAINSIRTEDRSVIDISFALWSFYDDLEDHKVALDKPGWDVFQRILLLLQSDYEIDDSDESRCEIARVSDWTQVLAAVTLLVQIYFLVRYVYLWFPICAVGGLISLPISRRRDRIEAQLISPEKRKKEEWLQLHYYPFTTMREMKYAVKRTGFVKQTCPDPIKERFLRMQEEKAWLSECNANSSENSLHFSWSPFFLYRQCFKMTVLS